MTDYRTCVTMVTSQTQNVSGIIVSSNTQSSVFFFQWTKYLLWIIYWTSFHIFIFTPNLIKTIFNQAYTAVYLALLRVHSQGVYVHEVYNGHRSLIVQITVIQISSPHFESFEKGRLVDEETSIEFLIMRFSNVSANAS